jgi:integrase
MKPNGGKYPDEVKRRLERELFPHIGHMPLAKIDAPTILKILRRVEDRGTIETAHKIKSFVSQVMRYGIACGLILHDSARDLSGAIAPRKKKHFPAIIDPKGAGALMRTIDAYPRAVVRCALKLAAFMFLRPGELRKGLWEELDIDAAEWRIPAERMKVNAPPASAGGAFTFITP